VPLVTIWGELRVNWRNILPPVLIAVALACVALSLRSCLWPRSENPTRDEVLIQYRRQLDSGDPGIVVASIKLLGELRDPKAVEPLAKLLEKSNLPVRLAAIGALGEIGGPEARAALDKLGSDPAAGLSPAPTADERARLKEALDAAIEKLRRPK
jgi:HEAT repeat protein